jgi:Domain of unknown function (DU1801)
MRHARRVEADATSEGDLMRSDAATVEEYLEELPPDRREAIVAVRDIVNAHLPDGFEEGMQFGMISWHVPVARYPDTYNGQGLGIAALASQKNHVALYLMGIYSDEDDAAWFKQEWRATGQRLDMGKSCVRFRHQDDIPSPSSPRRWSAPA